MLGSAWGLLAVGAVVASVAMAVLWIVQVRIGNATHVDVAWAILIACAAIRALSCIACSRRCSRRSGASGSGSPAVRPRARQLARWRADPANTGKTARSGLWAWSRHPNYFFEWVTWLGVAFVATAAPWGSVSWLVPAVLLFFLLRVTGIPPTEKQALSRSDYAEYQRTTSAFVPLPPKRG